MDDDLLLKSFSWTFALTLLFDIVYLAIFMTHFKRLLIGLIMVGILIAFIASGDHGGAWDSLGNLVLTLLLLCITGCIVMAFATKISIAALIEKNYTEGSNPTARFVAHTIAVFVSVLTILFAIFAINKTFN
jgi:hypothetical protein